MSDEHHTIEEPHFHYTRYTGTSLLAQERVCCLRPEFVEHVRLDDAMSDVFNADPFDVWLTGQMLGMPTDGLPEAPPPLNLPPSANVEALRPDVLPGQQVADDDQKEQPAGQ